MASFRDKLCVVCATLGLIFTAAIATAAETRQQAPSQSTDAKGQISDDLLASLGLSASIAVTDEEGSKIRGEGRRADRRRRQIARRYRKRNRTTARRMSTGSYHGSGSSGFSRSFGR